MKKLITLFMVVLFAICSCSVFNVLDSASYTFDVGKDFAKSLSRSAIYKNDSTAEVRIVASLSGSVEIAAETKVSVADLETKGATITIRDVPLNKEFDILIQGFIGDEPVFKGDSLGNTLKSDKKITITITPLLNTNYVLFMSDSHGDMIADVFIKNELTTTNETSFVFDESTGNPAFTLWDYDFDNNGNLWAIKNTDNVYLSVREPGSGGRTDAQWHDKPIENYYLHMMTLDKVNNRIVTLGLDQSNPEPTNSSLYVKTFNITDEYEISGKGETFYVAQNTCLLPLETRDISCIAANDDNLYVATFVNSDTGTIATINRFSIQESIIPQQEPITLGNVNPDLAGLEITDMLFQDGKLYVLVTTPESNYMTTTGPETEYEDVVYGDMTYSIPLSFDIESRGAVVVFDSSLNYDRTIGLCTEKTIYEKAFPAYSNFGNYLLYQEPNLINVLKRNFKINYKAPTTEESPLFFGPRKFIAIKPKKLVIADCGIFTYSESDEQYYKSCNRIVAVDLENFAIDVTKVNFPFIQGGDDFIIAFCVPLTTGSAYYGNVGSVSATSEAKYLLKYNDSYTVE